MKIAKGFTLIELIMAVVIGSVISIPIITIFIAPLTRDNSLEMNYQALDLAREKIEVVSQKTFGSITSEAQSYFSGAFSDFKSVVEVHYVASSEPDVSVDPLVTAYKWIKVTVSAASAPSLQMDLRTLVTNVSNQ